MEDLDHLRLLASALAGRTLEVVPAEPGEPAWTDGRRVHLDAAASTEEQLQMLAVQASLLAAGSLDPAVVDRLHRRPRLARRYLAVEGHRALAANAAVLPPRLLSLIDHARASGSTSAEGSLVVAAGRDEVGEVPPIFGSIRPRALLDAVGRTMGAAGAGGGPATPPAGSLGDLQELDDEPGDDGDLGHLLSSPVGGGGAVGRLLARLLTPTRHRDGGGPPGADAPTHRASGRPGTGRRVVVSTTPTGVLESTVTPDSAGATYPEWDAQRKRYRPAWCTVVESDPPPPVGPVQPLADGAALRRPLARLGIGLAPCRRQHDGEDIDIDAAVESRVDTLAGAPHEDDVYLASLRRRRDLAALVLLDVSGSAAEPGTGGRSVHEHQRVVAAALTTSLHDLGDRVALYGFRSRGRRAVQLLRVKAFDDRLDGAVSRRLAGLVPGAYTRLGAAIRHGTELLDAHGGTPRRLLIVVSDGFAYDHGYEGRYGESDAHRALVEARRRGIGCLCLTVGADVDPAALRRVFGAAAHAMVSEPEQLPALIGPLFRRALRTAEAQRRAHQRTTRTRDRLATAGADR